MLKRIYVNNYRCLVNFEMEFDQLTLLAGLNGGGKSALFDLLYGIRRLLIDNTKINEVFRVEDLTTWVNQTEQVFELDVQGSQGLFSYRLEISHHPGLKKQRIELEKLTIDGDMLFEFKQGEVCLYHDDHQPGPSYSFDWTVSALATVMPREDNKKLTEFKEWIGMIFTLSLQPRAMTSETREESSFLDRSGQNFSSWYRFISQEHQDKVFQLTEQLRQTIPGFHAFKLEQAGKHRILKVGFCSDDESSKVYYFDFEQLSDGQRVLIVLYALLLGLYKIGHTLFLDEPENFVALPEIQPWLMELKDACGVGFPQAVLISHHPELIDYLGSECGRWFERDPLGPTRVKDLPKGGEDQLRLSEQIARGWTE